MNLTRPLLAAGALAIAGGAMAWLSFGSLGENLVYYWSPTELAAAGESAQGATVRLGGLVQPGTMQWDADTQVLDFRVSDGNEEVQVHSVGSPPQMFREGIGVVVEGTVDGAGVFQTDRVMVKHSNEYKAPEDGEMPSTADMYGTLASSEDQP
jgi:cytochrome c-type biogenesis protein CcmE